MVGLLFLFLRGRLLQSGGRLLQSVSEAGDCLMQGRFLKGLLGGVGGGEDKVSWILTYKEAEM